MSNIQLLVMNLKVNDKNKSFCGNKVITVVTIKVKMQNIFNLTFFLLSS